VIHCLIHWQRHDLHRFSYHEPLYYPSASSLVSRISITIRMSETLLELACLARTESHSAFVDQDQWLIIHGRPPPLLFNPVGAAPASLGFVLLPHPQPGP